MRKSHVILSSSFEDPLSPDPEELDPAEKELVIKNIVKKRETIEDFIILKFFHFI